MGRLLDNLVDTFVENSVSRKRMDGGSAYNLKKQLECDLVNEVLNERADELEAIRHEREATRWVDDFRQILLQCVLLALLIGLLGSHLYDLLSTLIYHAGQPVNLPAMTVGTVLVSALCILVLAKEFVSRVFEAVKRLQGARGGERRGR